MASCNQFNRDKSNLPGYGRCFAQVGLISLFVVMALGWLPARGQDTPESESTVVETESDSLTWFGLRSAPLEGPLVTDRPDFTESTDAIPFGHIQLEAGYTFTYDREDGVRVRDHVMPELLLRVGLVEDFELRIGWEGYAWTHELSKGQTRGGRSVSVEDWTSGGSDLELGFKLKLLEQDGLRPHLGILGSLNLPTGSSAVSPGDVEPLVGLLWAYDLSDRLSLAGNVNFASLVEDRRRFFQTSASLSVAVALTDILGTYIEYYGFYPNAKEADMAHVLNGGLTILMDPNFQIDLRVGAGLNEEADDFFTGVGFSWRI